MHELSIAEALADQVRRHNPAGAQVRGVEIRVGALRGLEPEALRMCWDAVTHGTAIEGAVLEVDLQPWSIVCGACGRAWTSTVPFETCACGNPEPTPSAGDELDLIALTVEEPEP